MSAEPFPPTELGPAIRALATGEVVFGRYELRRKLGEGGFGAVWLVHDSALREEVALKFVLQAVATSPEAIDALKEEASRSRRLTHPNIVRIHDFVSDGDLAGISMEYVDGESLAQRRLREPGKCFDAEQIAPWIDQLCQALTYAHAPKRRVIHRDLKPPNLLLTADGELKVADFGIACSLINSVTQISGRLSSGTPPFMSPQQVGGDWPSETDDVYSLGATVFMLLTGTPPFHQGDIVHQILHKVPPLMRERRAQLAIGGRAEIPAEWEKTVTACLAKDAAQRPPSAEAVAQRLGLRGPLPIEAAPVARETIRVGEDRMDELPTIPARPAVAAEAVTIPDLPPPRERAPLRPPALPPRKPAAPRWRGPALVCLAVLMLAGVGLWLNSPRAPEPVPSRGERATPSARAALESSANSGSNTVAASAQPTEVRLLFPKNPRFLNYDRDKAWGYLQAAAWGYLDAEGHEVIAAHWLSADRFSEGLANVFLQGNTDFGYIDAGGQMAITAHREWIGNGRFLEGRARVLHPLDKTYGYIDAQGHLITPMLWARASDFNEGTAAVQKDDQCGFIDLHGQPIGPLQWESVLPFHEGLACVQTGGLWGYLDRKGQVVIKPQWEQALPFSEGIAVVARGKKYGFIERNGAMLFQPQWDLAYPFSEGTALVYHNGKCGFVDPKGGVISPLEWDEAQSFSESRALVKKSGRAGFLDPLGKIVIPLQYDFAGSFFNGLAIVKKAGGLWGCIDRDGKAVIPFEWNYIETQKAPDGRIFLALARIRGTSGSVSQGTDLPAEVRWVDATGRVLWQSP